MSQIVPAILEKDFETIQERIKSIELFANRIHLDVMDGEFVPYTTFNEPARIPDLITDLDIDVHLMVKDPDQVVMNWAQPGVRNLIVHQEVCGHEKVCPCLENSIQMIRDYEKGVGVAINPETEVEVIKNVIPLIDFVIVMTVPPGKSGQAFQEKPLEKIGTIKKWRHDLPIGVDGGVNEQNIQKVKQAGADFIISNSAVFSGKNPGQSLEALKKIIQ